MFRTLRFYHSFFKFLSTPSARRATQDQIHHLWRGGHFYPRPPRGGRPQRQGAADRSLYISIHALREESDAGTQRFCGACQISIHALREEGDLGHNVKGLICGISIHALREEGDVLQMQSRWNKSISIHALREEGDAFCRTMEPLFAIFLSTPSVRRATCSCHSRPSGSRSFLSTPSVRRATPRRSTYAATGEGFLSTPSVRRATQKRAGLYCRMEYFYPRPP